MKSKYVLDTSFISSLFNANDVNHKKALSILPESGTFIIPLTVMLELVTFSSKIKLDFYSAVTNLNPQVVQIDPDFIYKFRKFVQKTNLNLKSLDYSILYTAISKNANLLTFDEKLQKTFQYQSKNSLVAS